MRAVSIVGFKKSGKTALLGLLARALEDMGYSVGIIKHTKHGLDKQNTDTFWFMSQGRTVAGIGEEESAVFWSRPLAFSEVVGMIKADIILVEGGKANGVTPRILCLKDPTEAAELAFPSDISGDEISPSARSGFGLAIASVGTTPDKSYGPHFSEADPESAQELAKLILQKGFILPGLNCGACGHEDCSTLGMEMLKESGAENKCEALPKNFSVAVGGAELPLNPFTASIIRGSIKGMLKELKGYAPDQEIIIQIK